MTPLPYEHRYTNGTLSYDINDVIGIILQRAFIVNYSGVLDPHPSLSDYYRANNIPVVHRRNIYADIPVRSYFRGLLLAWVNNQSPIKQVNSLIELMFPSQQDYISWCDANYGVAKDRRIFKDKTAMLRRFPEIPVTICNMFYSNIRPVDSQLLDILDHLNDATTT